MSGDVVANLTKDLSDLDVELDRANTLFERTFWVLMACTLLTGLLVVMDLHKMYKKRGKKYKEQIPDECAGHSV